MKKIKKYIVVASLSLFLPNIGLSQNTTKSEIQNIDSLLYPDDISKQESGLNEVEKLAEKGSFYAQVALAQYFEFSTPPNYKKAIYWREKAADMHNDMISAGFILDYYHKGLVDGFDDKKLFKWHKYFVDEHHLDRFAYFVGTGYLYGRGVEPNKALAKKYLTIASEYGITEAKELLIGIDK